MQHLPRGGPRRPTGPALAGLRLKALERRAASDGVPADAAEDAMDSDNPKAVLVELLLARQRDEAELPD